ncbi:MAG: hypothetical protein ACTH2A_06715 [Glutamicibacter ardleyensis]
MNTPLNPDAVTAVARALNEAGWTCYEGGMEPGKYDGCEDCQEVCNELARKALAAYLAVAQPVVNSVESLPAKMRMLAWEGGEFEIGEIPEGHVLVGFEMATDRAWSMADKVTIHIERKDTINGR